MRTVEVRGIPIGSEHPAVLIAGPCVIENKRLILDTAKALQEIAVSVDIPFIFKSSYDKANRSSVRSFRGPGITEGLKILEMVKKELDLPLLSDVHTPEEAKFAASVLDILQIPAFLCRQTDLILAAAMTGKVVNVKKGQFLAPWDMKNIVEKIESTGNHQILLTERGTSFGYNNLVTDFRSLPILRGLGYPVIFDATHSVQLPGGAGNASSGQREFVPHLARAAMAVGCDGLFMEVHPKPDQALSDGPNMVPLSELKSLLLQVKQIERALRGE
ncbi:MAG TPA: 3-deoxy-8-phosphooctulonate synthase [Nitrospiria bacterium]|jgi:2-dehydro-3-deoxyphosphooctonate aldolase (KDO 8-P synthase)|nr:3-deoxy-8-phosphooctulonate synthase [Nitrospiria bacterium]